MKKYNLDNLGVLDCFHMRHAINDYILNQSAGVSKDDLERLREITKLLLSYQISVESYYEDKNHGARDEEIQS